MRSAAANTQRLGVKHSRDKQIDSAAQLRNECWGSLAKAANQRLRPLCLFGAVAALGLNIDDVREVFSLLAGDTAIKKRPYLRTYIDGQMVPALERKIWQSPIDEKSSFDDWFQQIFVHERSGLILNGAERWALSAIDKLVRWLQPKLEEEDPLRLGLEIVLFVGDYGFTPFGVHRDEPCASVIHFNLGPNAKDIYIFEHDTEPGRPPSLQDAMRYHVMPGDGFVLPANYAHIGDAAAFSVDISCKLTFRSNDAALGFIASPLLDAQHDIASTDLAELFLNRLGALAPDEPVCTTVEHWIAATSCRARSNAFFVGTPIPATAQWTSDSVLRVNDTFPLVLHDHDGQLTLFSRGRSLTMAPHDFLHSLLRDLRNCGQIRIGELLQHCSATPPACGLVNFLIESRGVTVSA